MDSIYYSGSNQSAVSADNWHNVIKAGGYRAVIFDCDGTLVDSTEAHFQSFRTAVCAQGHDLDRDWYFQRTGLDRRSLLTAFSSDHSCALDVNLASKQSINAFVHGASAVSAIPETADLVRALSKSYSMAVGTNAEIEVTTASLEASHLFEYFDVIVSISDGLAPKPAPDIFTHAMQRLGFPASKTLVFEDSAEGVRAAIAAGLDVIQVI